MKTKYAVLQEKVLMVEVIVMSSGTINVKVVEPNHPPIPSRDFKINNIFSSKKEAENYLEKL